MGENRCFCISPDNPKRINFSGGIATLPITDNYTFYQGRYAWIYEINNEAILKKMLPESDIELITKYLIEGLKQAKIATINGVSQKSISKKLSRIKKFLSIGV